MGQCLSALARRTEEAEGTDYIMGPAAAIMNGQRSILALMNNVASGRCDWSKVSTPCEAAWVALSSEALWVLGTDGVLHVGGGNNWKQIKINVKAAKFDVMSDSSAVWCVDGAGKIYSGGISEGSINFSEVSAPGPVKQLACAQGKVSALSADCKSIFWSDSKGASWDKIPSPIGSIYEVDMRSKDGTVWASTSDLSTYSIAGPRGSWKKVFQGEPGSGTTSLAAMHDIDWYYLVCPIGSLWQATTTNDGSTYLARYGKGLAQAGAGGCVKICTP